MNLNELNKTIQQIDVIEKEERIKQLAALYYNIVNNKKPMSKEAIEHLVANFYHKEDLLNDFLQVLKAKEYKFISYEEHKKLFNEQIKKKETYFNKLLSELFSGK